MAAPSLRYGASRDSAFTSEDSSRAQKEQKKGKPNMSANTHMIVARDKNGHTLVAIYTQGTSDDAKVTAETLGGAIANWDLIDIFDSSGGSIATLHRDSLQWERAPWA